MIFSTPEPENTKLSTLRQLWQTGSLLAPAMSCMGQFGLH